MDITQGLPAVLSTGLVASLVSYLVSLFAPILGSVPGLRAEDASRTPLLRTLVYALNVAGLLALAWTQQIVITRALVPALLYAAAGTVGSTVSYLATKAAVAQGIEQAGGASIPAVPPIRGTGG